MTDVLRCFDLLDVSLLHSRWKEQYDSARDYYVTLDEDDVLHGFRRAAGVDAPGRGLTGWCREDSSVVFGQWLSGLARMGAATGDDVAAAKAVRLMDGWAYAWRSKPSTRLHHYPTDKLIGGILDVAHYLNHREAWTLLADVTNEAEHTLDRRRVPAASWPPDLVDGDELEWYTLSENLYRAHLLSGEHRYREFGDLWRYDTYWERFASSAHPTDAHGVHAYSHLNTFSSAAMTYAVTGETRYLNIARNAYDWFQETQCYATGGFGPAERLMPGDGRLGYALESRPDSFEAPCGSWAGFKLSKYLLRFTGEARFGDWIERLLYNGIGAALPITHGGNHFYYADYRVAGGVKIYHKDTYACCSGTYAQAVADYHDLIYLHDDRGLYVNLYLPSDVYWSIDNTPVRITQRTSYPEDDLVEFHIQPEHPTSFVLAFRIPGWSQGFTIETNGKQEAVDALPGQWARVEREWRSGDRLALRLPLRFRTEPVDDQHPTRVAFLRGPTAVVFDSAHHEPFPDLPRDGDLEGVLRPDPERAAAWRLPTWRGHDLGLRVRPFYAIGPSEHYRMYVDLDKLPIELW